MYNLRRTQRGDRQDLTTRRHTLRDVARTADVSVATVSRVINMPDKVAPDTLDRVQDAMRALRFTPSAAARAVNTGRSRVVAALLPTLDNAIYARVVNGLETGLSQRGLSLVVAQVGDDPGAKLARAQHMLDIGAEAFVVAGVTHDRAFTDLLDFAQRPLVSVSYADPSSAYPTIGYDNAAAARLAAEHLSALGHHRIAVVHGPRVHNDRTAQRYAALQALGSSLDLRFHEAEISVGGGYNAAGRILDQDPDVTGIVCFSDVLAMGVLNRLHSAGCAVPDDYSVVGIENLPSSAYTHPPLTSVRLQIERMGLLAAGAVADWLEDGTRPDHILLPANLVQRASTTGPRAETSKMFQK